LGNSAKWTAITIAVVAGVLLGFALTTFAYRHQILRMPVRHDFIERLDRELSLTPDQHRQIEDLVRGTHDKVEDLRSESRKQRQQLILETHDKIRDLLTPDQQQKFDREFSLPIDHDRDRDHRDHDD